MMHTSNNSHNGYTIVELIIIMTVLGMLFAVLFLFIPDSQLRARDKERETDVSAMRGRLEEVYQDVGAYPSQITSSTFTRLDPETLNDPNGVIIANNTPVSDEATARLTTNPSKTGPQYTYTAYPTSCVNNCVGYILKGFIEQPSQKTPNPYVVSGLNNN
ncbi:MAG: prepilin-type N-terminal cleavage/methylation domain-containing protein [Candidatus Saccharimonadales bacterium]